MKISEMVTALEIIKEEYGDIEVLCWPYDGQSRRYIPTLEVSVLEKDTQPVVEIDGV